MTGSHVSVVQELLSSTGTDAYRQVVPVQVSVVQALLSLQSHVHAPQLRSGRQTWTGLAHPVSLHWRVLPVVQMPCESASITVSADASTDPPVRKFEFEVQTGLNVLCDYQYSTLLVQVRFFKH